MTESTVAKPRTGRVGDRVAAEPSEFDLGAAYLRRTKGDLQAFMSGLAEKLEGDLPDIVAVRRRRDGLFSRTSHVSTIAVTTGSDILTLEFDGHAMTASVVKSVRGVAISTKPLGIPEWLDRLAAYVSTAGEGAELANRRLYEFLVS